MANRNDKDSTGRTVAIVGGGALLLLLLWRGKGWGMGGRGGDEADSSATGARTSNKSRAPCQVRIDADGIEVDGAATDLATMTERCRAAGSADVRATGAAITGVVAEVIHTLQDAGVTVWAAYDVWNTASAVRRRTT